MLVIEASNNNSILPSHSLIHLIVLGDVGQSAPLVPSLYCAIMRLENVFE